MVPQTVSQGTATSIEGAGAQLQVSKTDFRQAMSRLAAAVNIITTDGPSGRAGFTASAVCSVTDEPPTVLVCLNRNASVYDTVKHNGVLCINTLAGGHQDLSNLFGGKTPMMDRFAAANWGVGITGAPILQDAVVSFGCHVTKCAEVSTHDVLFCEVRGLYLGGTECGLMYFGRQYHEICVPR